MIECKKVKRKDIIVYAEMFEAKFIAYVSNNGRIVSIELGEELTDSTICEWNNINHFVKGVVWHDWIRSGIICNELKRKVSMVSF